MIVSREFAELSAADAGAVRPSSVAVLPVGAIEQHGPHLPLNTDALVAEAAARAVVDQRGEELDLWLLPALAFGRSVEHVWAPGTLSLSTATFAAVLDDIGGRWRRPASGGWPSSTGMAGTSPRSRRHCATSGCGTA